MDINTMIYEKDKRIGEMNGACRDVLRWLNTAQDALDGAKNPESIIRERLASAISRLDAVTK